jgi:glutaredoxin
MTTTTTAQPHTAMLYRMVMDKHVCPYGLKAKDLLRRQGFTVEDRWLTSREATDAFKTEHGVQTTPQTFINGERIGSYDDLRRFFGKPVADPKATTYKPVIALFSMTALMALAVSYAVYGDPFTVRAAEWFIGFSMVVLALLKLQNVDSFATMFLNYDLLARRWVPYSYIYPFAEGLAGVLMIAGALNWLSIPVALFIGTIGAVSVFKAVYIDGRELKCACVGGNSNVPLGFVSLTENVMMVAMALWMLAMSLGFTVGQTMPGMQMGQTGMKMRQAVSPSAQAYMAGMERMNRAMDVPMTGDTDRDFATMMIPHHIGAIDMAKVQLQYGKDPMLRRMAQDVVTTQDREIAELSAWLAKR